MGTWSADILGNDTSCDVYERVLQAYDVGAPVLELRGPMFLQDFVDERTEALFGLALAGWEVGALDDALRDEVLGIVERGEDLERLRALGATSSFLAERAKVLGRFARRLATPKKKPRRRRPPPIQLETPFVEGACVGVKLEHGSFAGLVIVRSSLTAKKGALALALTTVATRGAPSMADFLDARLLDLSWELPYGRAARLAAPDGRVARLWTRGIGYERAAERDPFLSGCARLFRVAGRLPSFHRVLLGTTALGFEPSTASVTEVTDALAHLRSAADDSPTEQTQLRDLAELLRA